MKCPRCTKRAISFRAWGRGLAAFAHTCPNCGESLRASSTTIAPSVLLLLLIPVFILVAENFSDRLQITSERQRRLIFAGLFIPSVLASSFVVWKLGTYRSTRR
jgi:uncharacterized protein (DUF983 family)